MLETREPLAEVAAHEREHGEVPVGGRIVWRDAERRVERCFRLVVFAHLERDGAERSPRLGEVTEFATEPLGGAARFAHASHREQRVRHVRRRGRVLRIECERSLKRGERAAQVALFAP